MTDKNYDLKKKGVPLSWSLFSIYHAEECPICETESLETRRRSWIKKEAKQAVFFHGEDYEEYLIAEERDFRCKLCGFRKKNIASRDFVTSSVHD